MIPTHPLFGRLHVTFVKPGSGSSSESPDPIPGVGTEAIFAFGADWKYLSQTGDPGDFTATDYDDSAWPSGPGELGFGDGDEATNIGKTATNIAYFFRKTVDITSGSKYDEYDLSILFDDGVVVYVNGEEQARSVNWASGAIAWNQLATGTISDNEVIPATIPASAWNDGENVIAVQVSNNSGASSDVSFNMSVDAVKNAVPYSHIAGQYAVFNTASAVANIVAGPTSLDEISGMTSLALTTNIGTFAMIDDDVDDRIFFIDRDGASQGAMVLESYVWDDGEAMFGYTDQTTNVKYLMIGEIGDNGAAFTTRSLIRTVEPEVDGSTFTIAASAYEVIDYQFPATPTFVSNPGAGTNRGDSEAAFVCPIDERIYILTKREPKPRVYSLPLQSSYTGTQTLTYHGEINGVENLTSGPSSPTPTTNATEATLSPDFTKVLIKNYDKVFQYYRTDNTIPWTTVLTVSSPVEDENYVGLGSGPGQEPQGEAMTWDPSGNGYYTTSEYTGGGTLPLYYYPLSAAQPGVYIIGQGLEGYTGGEDTWIWSKAANVNDNNSSAVTLISDKNATDERWGFTKFGSLDTLFADNTTVTVTDASFTFYVDTEGQGIAFHEALSAIDASTVTYTTVDGTMSPGIGYDAVAMAEDPLADNFVGSVTVNFPVSTVQNWIRTPEQNFGFWHIATHSSDGQQVGSFEAASISQRPTLNFTISV
jgi:hypothetical protein